MYWGERRSGAIAQRDYQLESHIIGALTTDALASYENRCKNIMVRFIGETIGNSSTD